MSDQVLNFIKRKGGIVLLSAGHQYYKVKKFKNETEMWRCSAYKKLKCSGNIIFRVKDKCIIKAKDHTCSPDLSKNEIAMEVALLKDKVKVSTRPVPELYERAINKIKNKGLDIVTTIPSMSSIQHCLYDIRNKALGVHKTKFTNLQEVVVPSKFESFILADYYYEDLRIILFCSPHARQKIGEVQEFMGDGTFKSCPKPFYQLYSIHGDIGSSIETTNVMPFIFALLPNKSQATYSILFNLIKSTLPNFRPLKYHSDFEKGAINSILEVYPGTDIRGCYYHWHKALWRKRKLLKLKSKGQTRIVGLTAVLPLLPAEVMLDGYNYIKSEGRELNMIIFFKYIDSFWKNLYFSQILSVFGERHRTNNVLEGFHSKLNKKINKNTTILIRLLSVLLEMTKLQSKRRKLDIENDDYITNIQMQLVSKEISVGEALEKLRAYGNGKHIWLKYRFNLFYN